MHTQYEIGVIGAGNAAEGIVDGILRQSVLLDDRIIASDPAEVRRELFHNRFTSRSPTTIVRWSRTATS